MVLSAFGGFDVSSVEMEDEQTVPSIGTVSISIKAQLLRQVAEAEVEVNYGSERDVPVGSRRAQRTFGRGRCVRRRPDRRKEGIAARLRRGLWICSREPSMLPPLLRARSKRIPL